MTFSIEIAGVTVTVPFNTETAEFLAAHMTREERVAAATALWQLTDTDSGAALCTAVCVLEP